MAVAASEHTFVVDNVEAFGLAVRGYDVAAVDAFVQQTAAAVDSADQTVRARAIEEAQQVAFPVRFRGYQRGMVDRYVRQVLHELTAD
jgi:DivIVA domain-containing protein